MNIRLYILGLFLSSFLGGAVAIIGYKLLTPDKSYESISQKQRLYFTAQMARYTADSIGVRIPEGLNFVYAAEHVRPAVVHIKTRYAHQQATLPAEEEEESDDWFHDFHNFDNPFKKNTPRESAGSGVIISADGYIATNNHVIEKASEIEVILEDKRSYMGTVIGTDPTTDLALIKIDEENLPFVSYGNSEQLHIGEWVLAIGNPFDLTSTVTAGIVSAKGRNINILKTKDNLQIEAFIQTDAAVNPGNSGGALVNLKGELIGINTAIASNTGMSQGYSFAIPVSLTRKVMDDLLRYGSVQRALLGVKILDVDAHLAKQNGLRQIQGVYIDDINEKSAAEKAGLQAGDIILRIGEAPIHSSSELQSVIGTYRPGDKVTILFERDEVQKTVSVTLRNSQGSIYLPKPRHEKAITIFGAELLPLDGKDKKGLHLENGVKVLRLSDGRIKNAGIKAGFIITHIGSKVVHSAEEVFKLINTSKEAIIAEGLYPNGKKSYYAIAP